MQIQQIELKRGLRLRRYECTESECNVGLCLSDCFQDYHTLKYFSTFNSLYISVNKYIVSELRKNSLFYYDGALRSFAIDLIRLSSSIIKFLCKSIVKF